MRLSKNVIDTQLPPRSRRYEVADDKRPGLVLVTLPTGIRTWAIRWFADGKQYRFTLGRYTTLSVDAARRLATKHLQDIAHGANPQLDRIAERTKRALGLDKAESVAWAWSQYEESHVDTKLKPTTARELKRIGRLHILPKIGKHKLSAVSAREVKALVRTVAKTAPVGANRTQAVLSAFYAWAIDELLCATNPCAGLKKVTKEKGRKRKRILSETEIKWLWRACETVGYPWGQMAQIGLLTGARRGEVSGMDGNELDHVKRTWTLPPSRTKNKRGHVIYITDQFRAILKTIPDHKGPLMFTSNKRAPSGFSKAKKYIDAEMQKYADKDFETIEPWTIHDLRRSCASHMARLPGVNLATVSLALNHWSEELGGLREIYVQHDQLAATKAAFIAWGERLSEIIKAR